MGYFCVCVGRRVQAPAKPIAIIDTSTSTINTDRWPRSVVTSRAIIRRSHILMRASWPPLRSQRPLGLKASWFEFGERGGVGR